MSEAVTLALFSASRLNGEPSGCDLVFDVAPSGRGGVSQTECWGGKTISALRDRLMIEWVFTNCLEAASQLEKMVSRITELIKQKQEHPQPNSSIQHSSTDHCHQAKHRSSYIRVGVVCQNGAHLSVCFVERLYDHFTLGSRYGCLTVKRDHWDAMSGRWGKGEGLVWQQSIVPLRYSASVRDFLKQSMWKKLQPGTACVLEEAFCTDPLSRHVEIGDEVFNLQEGSVYDKRKKKAHRIRCTVLEGLNEKIFCRSLNHYQYTALTKRYRAAGILFYSVHPMTGEAVFLLGHITYCYSDWCDFGGFKNRLEVPRHTAARECYEETLGVLGKAKHLVECLEGYISNNAFKVVNENTNYVSHFLRVPYKDYPALFQKALAKRRGPVEVDNMRWFPLSSLRKAVKYVLQNQYNILVEPLKMDGSVDTSTRLPLRSEFAKTLCIADKLGILNSIEHITREIHHKQHSPTSFSQEAQPYVSMPGPRTREGVKPKQAAESPSMKEGGSHKAATAATDRHLDHPLQTTSTAHDFTKEPEQGVDTLSELMGAVSISESSKTIEASPPQATIARSGPIESTENEVDRSECGAAGADSETEDVTSSSKGVSLSLRKRAGKDDRVESERSLSPKKKGAQIWYFGMGSGFFRGEESYDI